ncbi:uncharacterized protein LOC143880638 [Tasmannia lanceolata]|uniref:uncharacterized protein LOC143880638 n=1 Tax=Tasmannia lanceolata TaxID=3420 RepID=UPI004063CE18
MSGTKKGEEEVMRFLALGAREAKNKKTDESEEEKEDEVFELKPEGVALVLWFLCSSIFVVVMDPPVIVDLSFGMTTDASASTTTSAPSSSSSHLAPVKNSYPQLNIAKFDGTNYLAWKVAIETYLFGRGKICFLREDPPSPKDLTYTRWEQEDALIQSLLWQSMTPDIYSTMILLPTAKGIWDHTAVTYSGIENVTRICSTYSEWIQLRRDDMSLETHYGKFISLCQQLDVFLSLTSDINILGYGNIPLLRETYFRAQQCVRETPSRPTSDRSALAAYDGGGGTRPSRGGGSFSRARGSGGGRVGSGRGHPYCTHCQRDGHVVETCYTLHPELRPPRSAHLNNSVPSDSVISAPALPPADDSFSFTRADYEELQHLRQSASQATAGFAQPGSSHTTLLSSSGSWIIDSEASNYMTGNSSQLSSFRSFSSAFQSITLADGSTTPITGIGTTCPSPNLLLSSIFQLGGRLDRVVRWMACTVLIVAPLRQLYTVQWMPFSDTVDWDYLSSHGIIHQSSCVYTSQQNCVVERKQRYLLEVAHTLLFQMHDSFPLMPRVFVCVCFVHHLEPGRDKLDPRSERYVFLGYSRTQKGNCCYSLCLRRWYVSADVTFFESESFFGSTSVPHVVRTEPDVTISLLVPSPLPPTSLAPSPTCPTGHVDLCAPRVDRPPTKVQYQRRQQQAQLPHTDKSSLQAEISLPSHQVPSSPVVVSDSPIASRTHSHSTAHPISNFVSYDRLTLPFKSFVLSVSSAVLPQSLDEALHHPGWRAAMDLEMGALHSNHT